MRLLVVTTLLLGVVVLCTAQDGPRRERLRNLISAARSGDTEARQALRDLRTQLKSRRTGDEAAPSTRRRPTKTPEFAEPEANIVRAPEPTVAPTTPPPPPTPVVTERRTVVTQEPRQQFVAEPEVDNSIRAPKPPRGGRSQFILDQEAQQQTFGDNEPHRALNRGLEIDSRSEKNANIRVTNETKTPPIETIRRYSFFDDEGSYVFGYEAADGSFKEEKRGLDCVVHGKYGYVDPDGVKREFSYTSGNQCDPNSPRIPEHQEEEQAVARPQNNQFLIQTQEKQIDESALNKLQVVNRKRQPAVRQQQEQQTQTIRRPQPQQPQEVPSRRFQPVQIEEPRQQQPVEIQPAQEEEQALPEPPQQQVIVEQPIVVTPRPPVVFRPTIQPIQQQPQFNFDTEFKNLFQFATNHFSPAQFKRPDPRPTPVTQEAPVRQVPDRHEQARQDKERQDRVRQEQARQEQARQEQVRQDQERQDRIRQEQVRQEQARQEQARQEQVRQEPQPTQAPLIQAPVTQAPRNQAHQLVFDAATGAFKTVPLANLVTVAPLRSNPPPQQHATIPRNPQPVPPQHLGARPISPFGASPLPSVPLGSLTFDPRAAQEFDSFFNQFHVRSKSK